MLLPPLSLNSLCAKCSRVAAPEARIDEVFGCAGAGDAGDVRGQRRARMHRRLREHVRVLRRNVRLRVKFVDSYAFDPVPGRSGTCAPAPGRSGAHALGDAVKPRIHLLRRDDAVERFDVPALHEELRLRARQAVGSDVELVRELLDRHLRARGEGVEGRHEGGVLGGLVRGRRFVVGPSDAEALLEIGARALEEGELRRELPALGQLHRHRSVGGLLRAVAALGDERLVPVLHKGPSPLPRVPWLRGRKRDDVLVRPRTPTTAITAMLLPEAIA
mmetsp:Transcript_16113/g.52696  ORF Transcript_16113/g.52696 Transcript_16113/m.52696 type:complete len:275 (+) Transcript_16113:978-1802(+)